MKVPRTTFAFITNILCKTLNLILKFTTFHTKWSTKTKVDRNFLTRLAEFLCSPCLITPLAISTSIFEKHWHQIWVKTNFNKILRLRAKLSFRYVRGATFEVQSGYFENIVKKKCWHSQFQHSRAWDYEYSLNVTQSSVFTAKLASTILNGVCSLKSWGHMLWCTSCPLTISHLCHYLRCYLNAVKKLGK